MARLVVIQGTKTGRHFDVSDKELVFGRSSTVDVTLEGGNVSRKHARVFCEGNRVLIEDLGSSNGTFLNDQPIAGKRPLYTNDVIRIGSHWLRFEVDAAAEENFTIQAETAALASNAELYRENASQKLKVILELSHQLARSLDTESLLVRVADQLMELFPHADRSMVILNEHGNAVVRVVRDRRGRRELSEAVFSRSVIRKVFEERVAVLAEDTQRLESNVTLNAIGVRSLMCVPLQTSVGRSLGALQLDRFQFGRPFTADDLHLLTAVALQVASALENANLHQDLIQQERIERDLALAREIQQGFLPGAVPSLSGGAMELAGELHPAYEISGDFYDFIVLDDRQLALVVADVSGKGMPAALFMTMVRALLRELLQHHRSPSEVLVRLNHSLARENPKFMFVTVLLAIYDVQTGRCTVSRAGHPPAIVRRRSGGTPQLIDPVGPLLGIESPCPPLAESEVLLERGDVLVLYTDGLTEAANLQTEEMFGLNRLVATVGELPASAPLADWMKEIRGKVEAFAGGSGLQDDLTLVLLRHG